MLKFIFPPVVQRIAPQKIDVSADGVRWIIPNFYDLPQKRDTVITSSRFRFKNKDWKLVIYPNGCSWNDSLHWLGIAAFHENFCLDPSELIVRFQITGESEEYSVNVEAELTDIGSYCCYQLTPRSYLDSRKDKMVPGGTLVVFFSAEKRIDGSEGNSAMQAVVEDGKEDYKRDLAGVSIKSSAKNEETIGIKELQQDFKKMLRNGNTSDVVCKVGGQEFRVHRCILASRSPVFLAMMSHDTKEKATGIVDITDADAKTFSDFLNYLYTGIVENITSVNASKLYMMADKYQVQGLKIICMNYMLKNISVDNFCDVLTVAVQHVEEDLTEACFEFFAKKSVEILLTSKWQIFLGENPAIGNELFFRHLQLNGRQ